MSGGWQSATPPAATLSAGCGTLPLATLPVGCGNMAVVTLPVGCGTLPVRRGRQVGWCLDSGSSFQRVFWNNPCRTLGLGFK